MVAAAVHVWARGRGREGAEVERQGSGRGPGGVPAPESIKHLNMRVKIMENLHKISGDRKWADGY